MIKVTGQSAQKGNDKDVSQQRCRRGCNDKGNCSRDVEEDVMIKVTGQSAEM